MPDFDSELDLLATDTVAILGSRTVTLRRPTIGTLNAATRQREAGTFTDYAVAAVKGEETPQPVPLGDGSARVLRCTYTVLLADLTAAACPAPTRQWRLVDGDEWQITETAPDVDGKHLDIACTRAG